MEIRPSGAQIIRMCGQTGEGMGGGGAFRACAKAPQIGKKQNIRVIQPELKCRKIQRN
jgi:hypothetical protein